MSDPNPNSQNQSAPTTIAPAVEATKKKRGFAMMDRAEVSRLAQRGGVAAHRAGTAHEFSSDEARAAGRKGGLASHLRRAVSDTGEPSPNN
jgi:general stress protein YciG